MPTWGTPCDKTNSYCQIIPTFVTALSYYPTRWAYWLREADTHTVGVLLSHLSSLKAVHHWGNRKINIDSAANLCIHHCCYMESFVCRCSPCQLKLLTRLINQDDDSGFTPDRSLSEMVLFKYKYVYKGTSNDSSFFLANKILNTLLKEWTNKWQLVVFPKKSIVTAFNDWWTT